MGSKQLHRLNALRISRETAPGYYPGGGLYLQISASGARSRIFRYMLERRSRWMGLGPLSAISLAEATAEAAGCRKLLAEGVDPIEARKADRERAALASPDVLVFTSTEKCSRFSTFANPGGNAFQQTHSFFTGDSGKFLVASFSMPPYRDRTGDRVPARVRGR